MKLKFEVIPATELEDGDIFYCTPDYELNEFGVHCDLTGTDQIFIRDDFNEYDDDDNYSIIVNGGWTIWFRPEEKVVRLGHYSELIRIIHMVKEGNPSMALGPHDIMTNVDDLKEAGHIKDVDLPSLLDDIESEEPSKSDNNYGDDDLPF